MSTSQKYNEEQEWAFFAFNSALDSIIGAYFALSFMERELGKMHSVTCKYREDHVARMEKEFVSAQERLRACAKDQHIGPTTPMGMSKAVKERAAGMPKWKVASEIGITRVTLDRVIKGYGCHRGTAHKVIEWLKQRG